MKQPAKDHDAAKSVKKSKKKVSDATPEGSTATADTAGSSAVSSTTASRLPAPAHGVVYFKQLAFQRRGGRRMIAPSKRRVEAAAAAAATASAAAAAAAAAAATAGQYNRGDEMTLVHPLAVYEATWLNIPGYTIHISLVDRSLGGDASRFFLRVGVVLEPAHGGSDELEVLEVVQNDAGKLLTPPLQYWIDLNVINVEEFYMGTFLQQSLRHIALRVHRPSRYVAAMVDQVCLVEAVRETAEGGGDGADRSGAGEDGEDDGSEESGHRRRKRLAPLIAVITDQPMDYFSQGHQQQRKKHGQRRGTVNGEDREEGNSNEDEEEEDDGRPKTALPPSPTPQSSSPSLAPTPPAPSRPSARTASHLGLDKTIAQRSVRVPIGPAYADESVLCSVRLSIMYPDAERLMLDPLPSRYDDITARVPATHVLLHVFPFYCGRRVAPKIVSFEALALKALLGPNLLGGESAATTGGAPPPATGAVAYSNSVGDDTSVLDALISEGASAAARLLARLGRLLCLRVDGLGRLRLGVVGAASLAAQETLDLEPYLDEEKNTGMVHASAAETASANQSAEYEHSIINAASEERAARLQRQEAIESHARSLRLRSLRATLIQSVWRRALARVRVRRLRVLHRSAVPIQCLARQLVSRARVRSRRQQIAREEREKAVLASAESWAPSLLSDLCPAHHKAHCSCTHHACTLQGTDVDLYCFFASWPSSSANNSASSADLVITVVDHVDPELLCRCTVGGAGLEQVASALAHAQEEIDASSRLYSISSPAQALSELTANATGREQLLAALSQGISLFVSRQMEFIKATWSVAEASTFGGVFVDDEGELVVGI